MSYGIIMLSRLVRKYTWVSLVVCMLVSPFAWTAVPNAESGNQYRADTAATIPFTTGTVPSGIGVYFEAKVSDTDGNKIKMEVELRKLPASFNGIATHSSGLVSSGNRAKTATAQSLAAGNYGWRYRVVDSTGAASNWVKEGNPDFIVQASIKTPAAPTPSSPSNYEEVSTLTPQLKWSSGSNFSSLEINLSKSPYGAANIEWTSAILSSDKTTVSIPAGKLAAGINYRWDITACSGANGTGTCVTSSKAYFSTKSATITPTAPTPSSPSNYEEISTLTPQLKWVDGSNFSSLQINLSKSPYGAANIVYTSTALSSDKTNVTVPAGELAAGINYRWDITACTSTGTCITSSKAFFSTKAASAPTTPPPTSSNSTVPAPTGSGTFGQSIIANGISTVGELRIGLKDIYVALDSDKDIDIQLYDKLTGAAIIKWPDGLLSGSSKQTTEYYGTKIEWSGFSGDGANYGREYVKLTGTLTRSLIMKVFGYEAGEARVGYFWGIPTPLDGQLVVNDEAGFFDAAYNNGVRSDSYAQHLGTDYRAVGGANIYAVLPGKVVYCEINGDAWITGIITEDQYSRQVIYGHVISSLAKDPNTGKCALGTDVIAGKKIGAVQTISTGPDPYTPHLHLGLNVLGEATPVPLYRNGLKWGWGRAPASTTRSDALAYGWWDVNSFFNAPQKIIPGAPISLAPSDDVKIATLTPKLEWSGGGNYNTLQINLSKAPYGALNIVYTSALLNKNITNHTIPAGYLNAGVSYRWDVTVCTSTDLTNCVTSTKADFSTLPK